ncbi:carbohydrate ABC transporter permease [Streptomyces cylindrosporus]|uniref:Carbohydrate ABC transporter permease n=1 Tax=Streptomyces cylindrosporus TaxID=2927583 RepID=A0ABS9Y0E4_9ACTN|nr:carbohydrate ABC transporter permease [Streptomyces cylindrosporus]MCI3270682.1 carbohydrate ABC transporter permease [Streptomyces cylindrosporus]
MSSSITSSSSMSIPAVLRRSTLYAILLIGALLSVGPYLLTLNAAFKRPADLLSTDAWTPAHPATFANFADVWNQYGMSSFLLHTLAVSVVVTAGQVVFSAMAAYALARLEFPGRDWLFWGYLATMMVPQMITLVPLFLMMRDLGMVDTYAGLVLPTVFGTPYGVFLVRQHFMTIPKDLESAARIDGATTWGIFVRIMLPLSRPILATLATITFINTWNNLIWPLIITNSDRTRVITVGIAALQGQHASDLPHIVLAGAAIALLPLIVVFLVFQRHIVRSIALTGLK